MKGCIGTTYFDNSPSPKKQEFRPRDRSKEIHNIGFVTNCGATLSFDEMKPIPKRELARREERRLKAKNLLRLPPPPPKMITVFTPCTPEASDTKRDRDR